MSSRRATLDEFVREPADDDAESEPESEPAWTPGEAAGACETCGGHVDPGTLRVVGENGSVPVCKRCYLPSGGDPFKSTATAVQQYRDTELDRSATDAIATGGHLP